MDDRNRFRGLKGEYHAWNVDAHSYHFRREQRVNAYGEWLDSVPWQAWATLTFRDAQTPTSALRAFNRWIGNTPLFTAACPYWWVVTEDGTLNGRTHLHALLGGAGGRYHRRSLWHQWFKRFGRAEILPFDQGRGATFYIAKYVTKDLGEYEIGGSWPDR